MRGELVEIPELLWVVQALRVWKGAFEQQGPLYTPLPVEVTGHKGSVGFMEVFSSYEDAQASCEEGTPIVAVQRIVR